MICMFSNLRLREALTNTPDSNEARFLIQRFPPTLADTNQVLVNTKRLLRAVWSREYTLIYQVLEEHQWPDVLKPLIGRYLGISPRGNRLTHPRLSDLANSEILQSIFRAQPSDS